MQIDTNKLNERFKHACPNGVSARIVDLITDRLSADQYWHVQRDIQPRRDHAYQRANEAGDRVRALKARAPELDAQAAKLKQQLDNVDPLTATPDEIDGMRGQLTGCEFLIERLADALAQAQAAEKEARQVSKEYDELNRLVDELTRRAMSHTIETRAELLGDILTDDERRRILENPEYLARKQAEAEKAQRDAEAAQRERERAAQPAPTAADLFPEIAAETSAAALADLVFGDTDPYGIKQEIMSVDHRRWPMVRLRLAPAWQHLGGDAKRTYALQRLVELAEAGQR